MSKVIKVITSAATASAQVTLSDGQVALFTLQNSQGLDNILEHAANGQLARAVERYGTDTPEDVADDYAQATDWTVAYEG